MSDNLPIQEWVKYPNKTVKWGREPDKKVLIQEVTKLLGLADNTVLDISQPRLCGKGHDKEYTITSSDGRAFTLRLMLDWYPLRVANNVATAKYLRTVIDLPIPKVVAYAESADNPLGHEYIVEEDLQGPCAQRINEIWDSLPLSSKESVARQLAQLDAQCFRKPLGKAYCCSHKSRRTLTALKLGMPSVQLFCTDVVSGCSFGQNIYDKATMSKQARRQNTFVGYNSLLTWYARVSDPTDPAHDRSLGEGEDARQRKEMIARLLEDMPRYFSEKDPAGDAIYVNAFSWNDILVSTNGDICGLLIRDLHVVAPKWLACRVPDILRANVRNDEPNLFDYGLGASDKKTDAGLSGRAKKYWHHMKEYEVTRMRQVYTAELHRLAPKRARVMRKLEHQYDFARACGITLHARVKGLEFQALQAWLLDCDKREKDKHSMDYRCHNFLIDFLDFLHARLRDRQFDKEDAASNFYEQSNEGVRDIIRLEWVKAVIPEDKAGILRRSARKIGKALCF